MLGKLTMLVTAIALLAGAAAGPARAQEPPKLTDEVIDRLASELAQLGDRLAQRPVYVGAPPASPPPAVTPYAYGAVAPSSGDSRAAIREFLLGVRELAKGLPPGSAVEVEAFTVDLPGGSVHFRLK